MSLWTRARCMGASFSLRFFLFDTFMTKILATSRQNQGCSCSSLSAEPKVFLTFERYRICSTSPLCSSWTVWHRLTNTQNVVLQSRVNIALFQRWEISTRSQLLLSLISSKSLLYDYTLKIETLSYSKLESDGIVRRRLVLLFFVQLGIFTKPGSDQTWLAPLLSRNNKKRIPRYKEVLFLLHQFKLMIVQQRNSISAISSASHSIFHSRLLSYFLPS